MRPPHSPSTTGGIEGYRLLSDCPAFPVSPPRRLNVPSRLAEHSSPVSVASTLSDIVQIGSVRRSLASDALHDAHLSPLVEAANPGRLHEAVISSRCAMRPKTARPMINDLFKEVYHTGVTIGAEQCLVSTRDELVSLFERFGFSVDWKEIH